MRGGVRPGRWGWRVGGGGPWDPGGCRGFALVEGPPVEGGTIFAAVRKWSLGPFLQAGGREKNPLQAFACRGCGGEWVSVQRWCGACWPEIFHGVR